jgi:hypothetical protein
VLVMFSLFCPLPSLRGVLELAPIVSNDLIIFSPLPYLREGQTRALHEDMEVDKIMRPFLTLGANSSTPRRHESGQNNENITNTRGKLEHSTKCSHYFVYFHVFVECSSLPLVLVMFSLFCPLPSLLGVLELAPSVNNVLIILEDMEVDKIIRTLLTLGANSSTPRRHGSGQNNESITNTRCNSSTPRRHGVFELAPNVRNVLIILSTSMSSWNARVCP